MITVNRTTSLNISEKFGDVNINYSANYSNEATPTVVNVNAYYSKPGLEIRVNRSYRPDGSYEPISTGVAPFDTEFDVAVGATVQNIFANYDTI